MGPFGSEGGVVHDGGADAPNEVVACLFAVSLREGVGKLFLAVCHFFWVSTLKVVMPWLLRVGPVGGRHCVVRSGRRRTTCSNFAFGMCRNRGGVVAHDPLHSRGGMVPSSRGPVQLLLWKVMGAWVKVRFVWIGNGTG